jgi:hypothetical protein
MGQEKRAKKSARAKNSREQKKARVSLVAKIILRVLCRKGRVYLRILQNPQVHSAFSTQSYTTNQNNTQQTASLSTKENDAANR